MIRFSILIEQHNNDMHKINEQRRWWLFASSMVFSGVIFLIFGWDWISEFNHKSLWWVIISLMLIICMNWWYWTMKVISHLLVHQCSEYDMIAELLNEIKELKEHIKQLSIDNKQ